jgi:hypothetical protein
MAAAGVSTARTKTRVAVRRSSSSSEVGEVADVVAAGDSPARTLVEVRRRSVSHGRMWGLPALGK